MKTRINPNKDDQEVANRLDAAESRQQGGPAKSFIVAARSLGTRPGINYDNIVGLLEELEGPSHR